MITIKKNDIFCNFCIGRDRGSEGWVRGTATMDENNEKERRASKCPCRFTVN